jgi:hypothetical protein
MISKVKCPKCNEIHDVEFEIEPSNLPDDDDWVQGIFKCIVFENPYGSKEVPTQPTIKDAKAAMRELEKEFLNKIIEFEGKYGLTIQYIETNLSGIPAWQRENGMRTNSVLVYGDL